MKASASQWWAIDKVLAEISITRQIPPIPSSWAAPHGSSDTIETSEDSPSSSEGLLPAPAPISVSEVLSPGDSIFAPATAAVSQEPSPEAPIKCSAPVSQVLSPGASSVRSVQHDDMGWAQLPDLGDLFDGWEMVDGITDTMQAYIVEVDQAASTAQDSGIIVIDQETSMFDDPDLLQALDEEMLPAGHHAISLRAKKQAMDNKTKTRSKTKRAARKMQSGDAEVEPKAKAKAHCGFMERHQNCIQFV